MEKQKERGQIHCLVRIKRGGMERETDTISIQNNSSISGGKSVKLFFYPPLFILRKGIIVI